MQLQVIAIISNVLILFIYYGTTTDGFIIQHPSKRYPFMRVWSKSYLFLWCQRWWPSDIKMLNNSRPISRELVIQVVNLYGEAWTQQDTSILPSIFSKDAIYIGKFTCHLVYQFYSASSFLYHILLLYRACIWYEGNIQRSKCHWGLLELSNCW